MSLPDVVKMVRSLYSAAVCKDCNSDRIVLFSTTELDSQLHVAKCIDCGAMGVLAEDKETQNKLIIFVNMLEHLGLVSYEIPLELIEFYQKAKSAGLTN